jgi:hypothetical protein
VGTSATVTITCGSCESKWQVPAAAATGYARTALESKPCPCCGLHTMAVREPEAKRPKTIRSFFVPRLAVRMA